MFSSIKTKILLVQTGVVISVVVCLGIITYKMMLNALVDSQRTNLEYLASETGYLLDRFTMEKSRMFRQVGMSDDIGNYVKKQQDAVLQSLFGGYAADFGTISYAGSNGIEQFKMVNGKPAADMGYVGDSAVFLDASKNPNTVCCVYSPGSKTILEPHLEFGFRSVNFFDECLGFVKGTVTIDGLAGDIEELHTRKGGSAMLVDSEGTILAGPNSAYVLKKFMMCGDGSESALSRMRAMESGYGRAEVMGTDSYFAFAPVPKRDWFVVAAIPNEEFAVKLRALRNAVVLVGGIVTLMSVLLVLAVAERITRPILALTAGTAAIAKGDFSHKVEIYTSDEIGVLAESFNRMQEELTRTTTSVSNLNIEIAERKKVEHALVRANDELGTMVSRLTQANRELEEFSHITAHDLKTPLRAIGSLAGMIAADYSEVLDDKGRQYLSIMLGRVERMNHFIKGILRYSELGRKLDRQWVDIGEVVCEAVAEISLPQDCLVTKSGDFPTLMCNRSQIGEVFTQLLGNAVKYLDKPVGQINVACEKNGDVWRFSVSDNGCGIDERYLDKIFRIFQTLNRRDEIESTGIGLSLVRKIVETYEGKVWVESRPGEGSTFFFTLPIQETGVVYEKLPADSAR
jgi:signal transduction histidine kinase